MVCRERVVANLMSYSLNSLKRIIKGSIYGRNLGFLKKILGV